MNLRKKSSSSAITMPSMDHGTGGVHDRMIAHYKRIGQSAEQDAPSADERLSSLERRKEKLFFDQ